MSTSTLAFTDCHDVYKKGHRKTGIYRIQIPGMSDSDVRCDMAEDGGWIVFQRRLDANVEFDRNMTEYINGFGQLNGSFWLGLDKIHRLAAPDRGAILRVDLKHKDNPNKILTVTYRKFIVYGENRSFQLFTDGFNGNISDGLKDQNWRNFSTTDCSDNEYSYMICNDCVSGGWWYSTKGTRCGTNLNGEYDSSLSLFFTVWSWYGLGERYGEISFAEMKLRFTS